MDLEHLLDLLERWEDPATRHVHPPAGLLDRTHVAEPSGFVWLTAQHALARLARRGPGDVAAAREQLDQVLRTQYCALGEDHDATFRITWATPEPPADGGRAHVDHDPNWRFFVGVVLALVLDDHADVLDRGLLGRCEAAVEAAVDADPDERVAPTYTNIALLKAWLAGWVGARRGDHRLLDVAEAFARRIADDATRRGRLPEFNSPTSTGVSVVALGLWVARPPSEPFASLGEALHAQAWIHLGALHHPRLGVLAGPHHRAHAFDPDAAVCVANVLVDDALGRTSRPTRPVNQAMDVGWLAVAAHAPVEPPAAALAAARRLDDVDATFGEEHGLQRVRTITAAEAVVGVETGRRDWSGATQAWPLVAHARDDGALAWLALRPRGRLADAMLHRGEVDLTDAPGAAAGLPTLGGAEQDDAPGADDEGREAAEGAARVLDARDAREVDVATSADLHALVRLDTGRDEPDASAGGLHLVRDGVAVDVVVDLAPHLDVVVEGSRVTAGPFTLDVGDATVRTRRLDDATRVDVDDASLVRLVVHAG